MPRRFAAFALGFVLAAGTTPVLAAAPSPAAAAEPKEGATVTLVVPRAALRGEWSEGMSRLEADVAAAGDDVTVNGRADWRNAGFPSLLEARIESLKYKPKAGTAQVLLATGAFGRSVQLAFTGIPAGGWAATFARVALDGPATSSAATAVAREAVTRVAATAFTGALADLPLAARVELVESLRAASDPVAVTTADRPEGAFVVVDLGAHPAMLSSKLLDATARARKVATERFLPAVDAVSRLLTGQAGLAGVVLRTRVSHRDLTTPGPATGHDDVELEVPLMVAEQYGGGALGAGDVIDASILRVGGKAVEASAPAP